MCAGVLQISNYVGATGRWNFQHGRKGDRDIGQMRLNKNSMGFHFN